MTRTISRRLGVSVLIGAMALAMGACGSDSDDDTTPTGASTVVETTTGTDSTDGSNGDLTPQEVDGVDPEKVLVAAILLGTGEVDVALSQGLVTADEVDLASIALRTGSLREWADRAVADR